MDRVDIKEMPIESPLLSHVTKPSREFFSSKIPRKDVCAWQVFVSSWQQSISWTWRCFCPVLHWIAWSVPKSADGHGDLVSQEVQCHLQGGSMQQQLAILLLQLLAILAILLQLSWGSQQWLREYTAMAFALPCGNGQAINRQLHIEQLILFFSLKERERQSCYFSHLLSWQSRSILLYHLCNAKFTLNRVWFLDEICIKSFAALVQKLIHIQSLWPEPK